MPKIHFFALSVVVFISAQVYAGMEQTRACNARIQQLESGFTSLQAELNNLQTKEKELSAECADLKQRRNEFVNLPLIPEWLKKRKQRSFDEKISKLKDEITNISKDQANTENKLQAQQSELSKEREKLNVGFRFNH